MLSGSDRYFGCFRVDNTHQDAALDQMEPHKLAIELGCGGVQASLSMYPHVSSMAAWGCKYCGVILGKLARSKGLSLQGI